MRDILMDTFKLGLGAMDLTREEAAKLVKKIQQRYPNEIMDGRKMVDDLVKQGRKNAQHFRKRIESEVGKAVKKQKLVEEKDLKELAANVKELAKTTVKIGKQVGRKGASAAKRGAKQAAAKMQRKASKRATGKKAPKRPAKRKPAKRKTTKRRTTKRKK